MSMTDISIDLETLGTKPGCPVLSIGLAAFDRQTQTVEPMGVIGPIDLHEQIAKYGLEPSGDTIAWWAQQSDAAKRDVFSVHALEPLEALGNLLEVLPLDDSAPYPRCPVRVWGNGASFDIAILEAFFAAVDTNNYGRYDLFSHRNVRDMRTIMDLAGMSSKSIPFEGEAHTALDDAVHQAKCILAAMEKLGAA